MARATTPSVAPPATRSPRTRSWPRFKGRFNLDVFRPHAVVKMTLNGGSNK